MTHSEFFQFAVSRNDKTSKKPSLGSTSKPVRQSKKDIEFHKAVAFAGRKNQTGAWKKPQRNCSRNVAPIQIVTGALKKV